MPPSAGQVVTAPDSGTEAVWEWAHVRVSKGGAAAVGNRPLLNLIEGANVVLTVADNPGSDRIDITIASTGVGTPASTVQSETSFGISPAVGTSLDYARSDHTHGTPAAPSVPSPCASVTAETGWGQASSAGSSAEYSRGDHTHGTPAYPTIPSASATVASETSFGLSSSAGSASAYSRGDHTHGTPSLGSSVTSETSFGLSASAGTATTASKSDHTHGTPANPVPGHESSYNHALLHSNANDPTSDQKAALAGTSGSPSATNKYVTNDDSRNTNARTPTSHSSAYHDSTVEATASKGAAGGYCGLDGSAKVAIANIPTGATSSTVCIGNDARLSDARTPTSHGSAYHSGTCCAESQVTFDNAAGHDHDGTDSKAVDHTSLANKGTNTHAQIDSHIGATDAHSATSDLIASRIILRDASGRAKIYDPSGASDIANKGYVDWAVGGGISRSHTSLTDIGTNTHGQIDSHLSATSAHSADSAATANRIIIRDSSGRAAVATPSASGDIATKGYCDGLAHLPAYGSKGTLLVSDGTKWTTIGPGTDGYYLKTDSGTSVGIKWYGS